MSPFSDCTKHQPVLLRRFWPFLLFLALVLLYFFPVLFQGKVMLFNDLYSQHFPSPDWAFKVLKNGQMPFWVGSVFCGFPMIDQGMIGFYNPIQFLLFYFLKSILAYHLTIIMFFILPLIFTYLFARRLSLDQLPAAVSAITFVFGGFYITRVVHMTVGNTMQYFPLGLYLIERSFQTRGRVLFWVSLVIGLQILSGYPQYLFFSVSSYSLYYLLRCLFLKPVRAGRLIRALLLWGLVVALGLGIGAIQFIPSQMLVSGYSHRRGGFDCAEAAEQSYIPWHLITYVFPNFYGWGNPYQNLGFWQTGGNYWEQACYVGILPLLLALFSLRRFKRNAHVRIFWLLAVMSFLLALGRYTPLFALLWRIPNLRYFRMPIRWTIITSFSLAVLAGLGLADILQNPRDAWERFGRGFLTVFKWCLVILLLVLIVANLLFSWGRSVLYEAGMKLGGEIASRKAESAGPDGKSLDEYMMILRRFLNETLSLAFKTVRFTSPYIYVPLVFLLLNYFLFFWLTKCNARPGYFGFFSLVLIVADLAQFGIRYNPMFDEKKVLPPPDTAVFLKKDPSLCRIYQFRYGAAFSDMHYWRELLKPNNHMIWGIDSATGYFPLRFKRVDDFERMLGEMLAADGMVKNGLKILGMMNVKYILTGGWSGPDLTPLVYREGIVRIYQNPFWLPRAFLVGSCRPAIPSEILSGLKKGELDLSQAAWLEGDPGKIGLSPGDSADIQFWDDMKATIKVKTVSRSLLFASIPLYPGWSATIDGRPGDIYPANYLFMAVPVDPGEHSVEFSFNSTTFKPGLIVTAISLLVMVIFLVRGPRSQIVDTFRPPSDFK